MAIDFSKMGNVLSIGFLLSISLALATIFLVSIFDYAYVPLDNIAEDLETAGVMTSNFRNVIANFVPETLDWIPMMDFIFVIVMITFISNLFISSYNAKRIGYFSLLGFLTFGIMVVMFVSSIFESITDYVYNIFFNIILVNTVDAFTFLPFYIENFALINLIIFVTAILLNFFDLNFAEFFGRKQKEKTVNVGETEL